MGQAANGDRCPPHGLVAAGTARGDDLPTTLTRRPVTACPFTGPSCLLGAFMAGAILSQIRDAVGTLGEVSLEAARVVLGEPALEIVGDHTDQLVTGAGAPGLVL